MPARKKAQKKTSARLAKSVSKVAKNPRRAVRKAAKKVHKGAARARKIGDSVITAGRLVKEAADFVDSVAKGASKNRG